MSVTLRVHPAMSVLQCTILLKQLDPRIHCSRVSLHLDGVGEMDPFITFGEYGLTHDTDTPLFLFFHAEDDESNDRLTPGPEAEFDMEEVHTEEMFQLSVVFANAPAEAKSTAATARSAASPPIVIPTGSRPASRPASGVPVRPASGNSSSMPSSAISAAPSSNAQTEAPTASQRSRPSSREVLHQRQGSSGSQLPPSTRGTGRRPETSDTSRRFLEDDGDIASQSSYGDGPQSERVMTMQQPQPPEVLQVHHEYPEQLQQQPVQQAPLIAGLRVGDLLDGYRMLQTAKVDLPEEVSRVVLTGCNPPLVDAVPEHLAEFTNLHYLDVSGNNLPFDRLRLLPQLDELNLSCNNLRDFDFSPIPGIHYAPEDEVAARGEYLLEDMIGFPALTKLDLSYNYASQTAIHILSVLPKLLTLSLASNDLVHLPSDLSNFWKLSRLSLRDNRLGSGSLTAKFRAKESRVSLREGRFGSVQRRKRGMTRPDSARSAASEDEDEREADDSYQPYRKEFKLFHALSTLPNLVELDLSENCLVSIPSGAIPDGEKSFPKLQFLNLASNQLANEAAVLPLGDIVHLSWIDVRNNPFILNHRPTVRPAHASARAHQTTNWAVEFPDLYHVLVETCHMHVVMAAPKNSAQNLQQDLGHILQPGEKQQTATFQGKFPSMHPVETEAQVQRARIASAKLRSFADAEARARASQASINFNTTHESLAEAKEQDSLQRFVEGQKQLMSPAKKPEDTYAEQYDAYSTTFLTGVTVDELKQTSAFQEDLTHGAPITTSSAPHYAPKQLAAKKHSSNAEAALRAMLSTSAIPVTLASRPNRRVEAPKPTLNPVKPVRDFSRPVARDFTTNKSKVGIFGVRQPKVAKVYSRMAEVLDHLEATYTHPSGASSIPTHRKPNVRGAQSSAYVDPVHERTQDKLRAARHQEKERGDVQMLLKTVAEVSKATLT